MPFSAPSRSPLLSPQLRSAAESQRAAVLARPVPAVPKGFGADDGASLLMAFRGLQAEALAQAKAHENVAKELISLVLDPFAEWAQGYKAFSIHVSRAHLSSLPRTVSGRPNRPFSITGFVTTSRRK